MIDYSILILIQSNKIVFIKHILKSIWVGRSAVQESKNKNKKNGRIKED